MVLATQARASTFQEAAIPALRRNKGPGEELLLPQAWGWGGIQTKLGRNKRPQPEALEEAHSPPRPSPGQEGPRKNSSSDTKIQPSKHGMQLGGAGGVGRVPSCDGVKFKRENSLKETGQKLQM